MRIFSYCFHFYIIIIVQNLSICNTGGQNDMKLEELINQYYNTLKPNDLYIWKYIATHKSECKNLTIDELAHKCNTSRSSILRFAQRLSLKGYSELKFYLRQSDNCSTISNELIKNYCFTMADLIRDYGNRDYSQICEMIYHSQKVFLYGTGTLQRNVANEMRRFFLAGHEHFYMIDGVDELSALFNTLTSEDLVFVISLNGKSDNAINFAQQLSLNGIPFISMTRIQDNKIAHYSSQSIYVDTPEFPIGASNLYQVTDLYFILADILFLNYMQYKSNKVNPQIM